VETKLLPVTVSVNPDPPAVAVDGEIPVNEGDGLLTVNASVPVDEPSGLTTPMDSVAAEAMSLAGIAAVSWLLLTNVVVRFEPLTRTVAPFTKFEPLAVSVKAGPPAVAELGEIVASDGAEAVTVSVSAVDVPPPGAGVETVIDSVPAAAMSDAGIAAVNWVEFTKVVVRLAPLTCTTDVETKLLPVTVSVNPGPPALAVDGEILVNEGEGLLTVNESVPVDELSGLTTPMDSVPADAMSLAGIAAVSCVALTNVVVRFEPFTWTVAPFTKFEPLAVSVKPGPPAVAVLGEMLLSDGAELVTVKVNDPEVPLPGVLTVMEREPAVLVSLAVNVAVNCVLLTKVVARLAPLT
jgi:hypothetical protein